MPIPYPYAIPTDQLAEVLIPLIERLDAGLTCNDNRNQHLSQGNGAIELLGERIGPRIGVKPDAIKRRIYDIKERRSYTTNSELADALLCELGVNIGDTDIPTLAGNPDGALDMVECWADFNEPGMPTLERRKLAKTLHSFCHAYVKAAAPEGTAEYLREQADKKIKRREKEISEYLAEVREAVAA